MEDYNKLDEEVRMELDREKEAMTTECSCSFKDAPEPKWHDVDCSYRIAWVLYAGNIHMNKIQLNLAIKLRQCNRMVIKDYQFSDWDVEMFKLKGWL